MKRLQSRIKFKHIYFLRTLNIIFICFPLRRRFKGTSINIQTVVFYIQRNVSILRLLFFSGTFNKFIPKNV